MQPVDLRHGHVEDDDVGVELLVELDGLGAPARLADHLDVELVFEDAAESLADQRMIVGEQDADTTRCHATSLRAGAAGAVHAGTRSCTRTPPCSRSREPQLAANQFRALAHADQPEPAIGTAEHLVDRHALAVILDLEAQALLIGGRA